MSIADTFYLKDQPQSDPEPTITAVAVEISKLSLGPGDLLLIKCPENTSQYQITSLLGVMKRLKPDGVKVLAIAGAFEFTVLTGQGEPETGA